MKKLLSVIVFLFLFFPLLAVAGGAEVKLDDGATARVSRGKVELLVGGKSVFSYPIPDAPAKSGAVSAHPMAGDLVALHGRVPLEGDRAAEAVLLRRGEARELEVVWSGITGLKGDVGEKSGVAARFDDLTGDGVAEIAVGEVSEAVRLCGADRLPLLFRQVFDPGSGKLRPVLALRPGLADAVDIEGTFSPGDGPTSPLVRQASPSGASRSAGDQGELVLLSPPSGLADSNPATAWMPVPGNGAGELASLEMLVTAYGVVRLGVRALPAGKKQGRYDRPRSLLLATEGAVYRLRFPVDPLTRPDETVWFDLPEAVKTTCLTLIVEESWAPSPKRHMALAEVVVLTEADGPEGLVRLAGDLRSSERRRQAAMLLGRAGKDAVPPIRAIWSRLDWQGKQRAVTVIADSGAAAGADLLAEAAVEGDPALVEAATRGLRRAGEAAVQPLVTYLSSAVESRFVAATDLLAGLGTDAALEALIAASGQGGRQRRIHLRARIAMAAGRSEGRREKLCGHIDRAAAGGFSERLIDLLRAASTFPTLAERVAGVAAGLYEAAESFGDRYRLLEVLSRLGCAAPLELLVAAAGAPDRHLRAEALTGLGGCADDGEERSHLLRAALVDDAPEVRLAALEALSSAGLVSAAGTEITVAAKGDPWPQVRAAGIAALAGLPEEAVLPVLEAMQGDRSERVRAAVLRVAIGIPGERTDRIVVGRLVAEEELPRVKAVAAKGAGRRCQGSALDALFGVLRVGAEPLAGDREAAAAVAAAEALGAIGGETAKELLEKARRRSNPVTDRAIDAALANLGKACGR